ncbi:helix-turn-helix domain-containing protein [Clostridium magnum]|uniref:HTH-type transcriptional regulator SinR n=1 Tax=Clostridium magnum DSM 2767 TaxID=1121326 RepID=A0A168E0K4_9CLOT|nr:helix-turn-helix transcriptional regulator [Clostridium magnum]KZL93520.1 HTH-type transcriptional regulator SinR [Clostridium magnum DSM 2767]SHI27223.1 DNA-binding transcriptional regulator, XRE family [Clostridium magnum DSM 2767]
MNISELGQNIKKVRDQKGWTLNKLKQESGVGYATLHDIENGKSQNLNSSNLEKVAKALDVTTNELLGIDVVEYTVIDLEETLDAVFQSDELELDGVLINSDEKEELKDLFAVAINNIRRRRRNK